MTFCDQLKQEGKLAEPHTRFVIGGDSPIQSVQILTEVFWEDGKYGLWAFDADGNDVISLWDCKRFESEVIPDFNPFYSQLKYDVQNPGPFSKEFAHAP
jgi:hypothetical protein